MEARHQISIIVALMCLISIITVQCDKKDKQETATVATAVTPVELPTNIVPGFKFPEDSSVILGWTRDPNFPGNYDSVSVYKHAWGIWAGLTAPTNQSIGGQNLLTFETWFGLNNLYDMVGSNNTTGGCEATAQKTGRTPLTRPKQFEHAARFSGTTLQAQNTESNSGFWVTVSYSPAAACYATTNSIFKTSVLNQKFISGGQGAIPVFPNNSITIKPTYMVYDDETDGILQLPAWNTAPVPANADFFGSTDTYVLVDTKNGQTPNKTVVPISKKETDPTKIANATCNLTDFIYFKVDQTMADFMNKQDSVQGMNNSVNGYGTAKAGQLALLVAMHVTTKEISNWTWQSYYWTPNPANPGSPSSVLAANNRPVQITGAAAHYAANAAYVMTMPGKTPADKRLPMFGYNPYLEGGFGPTVFPFTNTQFPDFKYGVQSNCMSCHALAIADTTRVTGGLYTTDQEINLKDPYFNNQVSLDFAWSIQTALIYDSIPYWINKK